VIARPDAILFDLGGTLDGPGGWRDRFHHQFEAAGVADKFPFAARVRAFDYAEERSHAAAGMASAGLRDLVRMHVGWQFESLGAAGSAAAAVIADRFVRDAEAACAVSREVLRALAGDGFPLGVVSNGCGNVATLCAEYGFAPLLSVVVDSHAFGRAKPDPEIFLHATSRLNVTAARAAFVGDSLDRDIAPAKALGMRTFWLADAGRAATPDVDVALKRLADLPGALRHQATGGER
jgi:HAD superfamily hydrolase (TIGR01509 family)